MRCYETSKIETQWTPRQPDRGGIEMPVPSPSPSKQRDAASGDEATTTTNSDSCAEATNTNDTKKHEKSLVFPHHRLPRLSRPKLRGLLAALSFEDYHPKPFRRKQGQVKSAAASGPDPPSTSPSSSSSSSGSSVAVTNRGTRVDSDEASDVFFDAEQFGDDLTSDSSFGVWESEVLNRIKVSSFEGHQKQQQQDTVSVETEIMSKRSDPNDGENTTTTNFNSAASESEDEIEYSEHEFHHQRHKADVRSTTATTKAIPLVDSRMRSHSTLDLIPEAVTPPPRIQSPPMAPPAPTELPLRFLRAGKNDPVEGMRRYQATLEMRQQNGIDTILREASPDFATIKRHYPHYFMGKGKNGEPCFYEQPPKTNLRALRDAGVTLDKLLRHYTMVTEFQWNYLERDDLQRSIYVIDLEGIRMTDFVGEAVDFVKKAAAFSAQHYPERAGYVYVINVPAWFKLIWNVISPIIDADTLQKIYILRGKEEIRTNLQARIPLENIPVNFGGTAVPLGESPEETELADLVFHNNALSEQGRVVCAHPHCKFCHWTPARRY